MPKVPECDYTITRAQLRKLVDLIDDIDIMDSDDEELLELLDNIQGAAGNGPVTILVPKADI